MSDYIRAIYNANVYIDGNNHMGKASEVKLPDFEITQDEFKGLGVWGTLKLPSGAEALEGEITWNSLYPDVAAKAYHPFRAVQLMIRANQQIHDARGLVKEVPVVTTITATMSKAGLGNFKHKEKSEHSSTYQATEIRQVVEGREVLYYNAMKNVYRVNGEDVLSNMRKNIGA
ncbi:MULTISPECIES: phage major tail tube protein [unclassified Neisseria]|uniref:phage major tail tube protein n=1 Tax=unclassified Neisseria TaxID=2623750 RepID=UPI001072A007|nr:MULTISPECIES: phage major tail tube protein [unclassified Neisseria]MBF0802904.1 phage major tail tube protein [Neisseria sp. 19428wB4_WF04]TFU44439.1 phage major tail tube protein [Neisseria sp. WF04]